MISKLSISSLISILGMPVLALLNLLGNGNIVSCTLLQSRSLPVERGSARKLLASVERYLNGCSVILELLSSGDWGSWLEVKASEVRVNNQIGHGISWTQLAIGKACSCCKKIWICAPTHKDISSRHLEAKNRGRLYNMIQPPNKRLKIPRCA